MSVKIKIHITASDVPSPFVTQHASDVIGVLSGVDRLRLMATLRQRLRVHAPGLTPKAVLEKLATIQMLDVWLPTTDGRWLVLPRYTQPEEEHQLLLEKLKLELPAQPPPRIHSGQVGPPACPAK